MIPVDPEGDLQASIVQGQVEPELLGWRVYGKTARESPVPTYSWKASKTFSRAWVIQMQQSEEDWPVASVTDVKGEVPGELTFSVKHKDGRHDHFHRRFPESSAADFTIVCNDAQGKLIVRFDLEGGVESIAKFPMK